MGNRVRAIAHLLKGLYDLVATWILLPVLVMACAAWGLFELSTLFATFTGDETAMLLWRRVSIMTGLSLRTVRLGIFVPAQIVVLVMLWRPMSWARRGMERLGERFLPIQSWISRRVPALGIALGIVFSLLITTILVPFVLQPTLVPMSFSKEAWLDRVANLADGTASRATVDSVLSVYHHFTAPRTLSRYTLKKVRQERVGGPMMDRWDALIRDATTGPEHFAQTKAFMWVESAGRQYAVSNTGCLGLMQFCVSTAQRRPFRGIFGAGAVTACGCSACTLPRSFQDALETDPDAPLRPDFPCDPSDARFDAEKAIRAGAAYTQELSDQFGGNLYLMYIGYNSGPAVSRRLWKATGKDPNLDLKTLRTHLAPTLKRWYGSRATSRANGLLDTHLPKLHKAYTTYLRQERHP